MQRKLERVTTCEPWIVISSGVFCTAGKCQYDDQSVEWGVPTSFQGGSELKTLQICICLIALAIASGCTTAPARDVASQGVAVYPCTKNPLLRSTGLFGGAQQEMFLSGPNIRREPPPAVGSLTRVLNVTEVDRLEDPGAEPIIDKCSSWLQSIGEDEVDVTIRWRDWNCPDSFDDEDQNDCRSRASFRFSHRDLGIEEVLDRFEDPDAAIQRLLVVDAYFTQEIQPTRRHSATGMPLPERGEMHLVVRVMRAPPTMDSEASATVDDIRKPRSQS
jgi:hypothetical protein